MRVLRMEKEKKYQCSICKKTVTSSKNTNPLCCGKEMNQLPLDPCMQPAHAEHARSMQSEDACDEFRSG